MTNIYAALRQWDTALEFGERYSETARRAGDPVAESVALATVAYVYAAMCAEAADRGDTEKGQSWGEQSVELSRAAMLMSRESGNRLNETTSLANLARCCRTSAVLRKAWTCWTAGPSIPLSTPGT